MPLLAGKSVLICADLLPFFDFCRFSRFTQVENPRNQTGQPLQVYQSFNRQAQRDNGFASSDWLDNDLRTPSRCLSHTHSHIAVLNAGLKLDVDNKLILFLHESTPFLFVKRRLISEAALLLISIYDTLKWDFSVSDIDKTRAQTSELWLLKTELLWWNCKCESSVGLFSTFGEHKD